MSMGKETLAEIEKQLQKKKELGNPLKQDFYKHLIEVLNRIQLHNQHDGYEKFEEISALVKKTNFEIIDPYKEKKEQLISKEELHDKQMLMLIEKTKYLLLEKPQNFQPKDNSLVAGTNVERCVIPNFIQQAQILEQAGIGFGEETTYLIQKSLQRLAYVSGTKRIRFFGKILCTQKDYWVAEGFLPGKEEELRNQTQEPRGKGANDQVFWVTHNLMNDWIQLPDVEPEMIQIARKFKRVMTGDLNAVVNSSPAFPAKERHLLRAQLARINHSTSISPKGFYEVDEESGEIRIAEETPNLSNEDMKNLENWSHSLPLLLKSGRCSHFIPGDLEEEAKEEFLAKLNEQDKSEDKLKPISEDSSLMSQGLNSWSVKITGDIQSYNKLGGGEGTVSYAVGVISSLRWPGAVTVAKGGQYCSIYVGDTTKRSDSCFYPQEPPEVIEDPEDGAEQPEPQGKAEDIEKIIPPSIPNPEESDW